MASYFWARFTALCEYVARWFQGAKIPVKVVDRHMLIRYLAREAQFRRRSR